MDEENIVRRMIDGDMEAFGTLMERYGEAGAQSRMADIRKCCGQ